MKTLIIASLISLISVSAFASSSTYQTTYQALADYHQATVDPVQKPRPTIEQYAALLKQRATQEFSGISKNLEVNQISSISVHQLPAITLDYHEEAIANFEIKLFDPIESIVEKSIEIFLKETFKIQSLRKIILAHQEIAFPFLEVELAKPTPSYQLTSLLMEFEINPDKILDGLATAFLNNLNNTSKAITYLDQSSVLLKNGAAPTSKTDLMITKALEIPLFASSASNYAIYVSGSHESLLSKALIGFNSFHKKHSQAGQPVPNPKGLIQLIEQTNLTAQALAEITNEISSILQPTVAKIFLQTMEKAMSKTSALEKFLALDESYIQKFAARYIYDSFREPELLDALIEVVNNTKSKVNKNLAISAISQIQRLNPLPGTTMESLVSLMLNATYDNKSVVRDSAASALGFMGKAARKALPRLNELLADVYGVKISAKYAIKRILES